MARFDDVGCISSYKKMKLAKNCRNLFSKIEPCFVAIPGKRDGPRKMHFLAQNCNFGAKSRSTSFCAEVGQENEPLEAFLSFLLKKAFLEFCKFFRAKPFGWIQKEPKNATFIAFFNDLLVISISPSFIHALHICSNKLAPKRINNSANISYSP